MRRATVAASILLATACGTGTAVFPQSASVEGAIVSGDGREVRIVWMAGPCGREFVSEELRLVETRETVNVDVLVTFRGRERRPLQRVFDRLRGIEYACTSEALYGCTVVALEAPLGERQLREIDGDVVAIGEDPSRVCDDDAP